MLEIVPLCEKYIDAVAEIEQAIFPIPWSKKEFLRELNENKLAVYFVAVDSGCVAGYGGMWHIVNEGHITNIAVREDLRRKGVASAIVKRLLAYAQEHEMIALTLEVRISNLAAQRLYTGLGFKPEGFRKAYYQDTGEDAVVMWKNFDEL